MASANTYKVSTTQASFATAQTILQLAAPSGKAVEIIRVSVSQGDSTASSQLRFRLYRGGAAMTWTSPVTPSITKSNPSDNSAGSVVTAWGTSATDGASPQTFFEDGFNALNGYLYLPVPEERETIAANGWCCLKLLGTVPSATWCANVVWREIG